MTHVTCRLAAKNRDQLRNPIRSVIEYGLPFLQCKNKITEMPNRALNEKRCRVTSLWAATKQRGAADFDPVCSLLPLYTTTNWNSFAPPANKKVAHIRLSSVGFRSWSRFLAVSLQVTWHYFPPGPQLPPQPLRGMIPILLLGEQRHNGCKQFV